MSSSPVDDPLAATESGTLAGEASDATRTTDDPTSDPDRIGRFVVTQRLGAGAMGVVYAGRDEMLGRKVAIKLIAPDRSASPEARDRMLREAQALAKLSHPNVVPVYEAGTHEGQIFVAMEYVEGRTLRQYTESAPGWRAIVAAYIQAGRGLAAAHDAGLVHRDFKPDNAMLGDDGRVRVLDFGVVASGGAIDPAKHDTFEEEDAEEVARLTRTGAIMGTPAYMAPEQFRNHPIDARADQFAFCVALHEAVYGQRPHLADNIAALAFAVIEGKIDPPPRKDPRWLYRLLRRGLATDPTHRYAVLHALLFELERGLGRRGRAALFAGAAAAAASLVLGLGLSLAPRDETRTVSSASDLVRDSETGAAPQLATPRQVSRLLEDSQVVEVAISPDGDAIAYVTVTPDGQVLAAAPTRGGPEVTAAVDPSVALGFASTGEVLSLEMPSAASMRLFAMSTADGTRRMLRHVSWPFEPDENYSVFASSTDMDKLTAFDFGSRSLFAFGLEGQRVSLATTDGAIFDAAWSPDATRLAWIEDSREHGRRIVMSYADGSAAVELLRDPRLVRRPCGALTFVGNQRLAYALYESQAGLQVGQLWEIELDPRGGIVSKAPRPITPTEPGTPCRMTASDDGRKIAFLRQDRRETIHIAAIGSDGRLAPPRPASRDTSEELLAGWAADARTLLFVSARSGEPLLYARSIGETAARPVMKPAPSSSTQVLTATPQELRVLVQPEDHAGPPTMFRVAPEGTTEILGTIENHDWPLVSCAPRLCTIAVFEGDSVVIRELAWSGSAGRELARVASPRRALWALAPDGSRGALAGLPDWNSLLIVSFDGTKPTTLSVDAGPSTVLQAASWAADGSSLLASGVLIDGHLYAIVRMDLDGSYEVVHTEANRWIKNPHVAPDGRHLAFTTWDFSGQVWLVER